MPAEAVLRRWSPRWFLATATVIAAIATAGSLWLSLGLGLVPCRLCWYQRILMYPLVVILGVATIENRPTVYRTVLPLAGGGLAVASYHSWLQRWGTAETCGVWSCARIQYTVGGLAIPNLAAIAFALIVALTTVVAWRTRVNAA